MVFAKDQQAHKISTVIDGQQRLVMLTLLLCAIRDNLDGIGKCDGAQYLDGLIKQSFLGI